MTHHDCTIFFLPGLGFGSAAAAPLAEALSDRFRVVGIDLPGQGDAPNAVNGSVHALADAALTTIKVEADGGPWLLAAHSMGGKVAALVAARVLSGHETVFGLAGAALLAPSPPTPEPMDDDKRALMLSWADNGPLSEVDAHEFVAQNVATSLPTDLEQDAITQVRQMSPLAWQRWLSEGSRENISAAVGVIDLPVVVIAGEDDDDLGASVQPRLLGAVYPRARFVSLPATGHLLPYEQAHEVAAEIARFWELIVSASPPVAPEWGRLIASDRTAAEARALLARRAIADDVNYTPRVLSPGQLATLRALSDRLVPQSGARQIDLATRIDADLASGRGDGWRPAELPGDASAYRLGLDAIASVWADNVALQDALIRKIIAGDFITGPWNGDVFRQWFDDVRNDLTRTWLAHPASLARIGYDGFATSGPGATPAGYVSLGAGVRDPWEPEDLGTLISDQAKQPNENNDDSATTNNTGQAGKENAS
ncbi:alpha/beta hydrolase [Cryobacterium sp. CG_9.6]|uniref:alpha/beta hydrolase n=1 Tax=Cryobacterium sp. CG_9.6 TaxID=2760710 RepID=UPI002475BBE4|nr:alpha/beta hydrolase [Cryobacterium sp. CG_9.6]MDH6238428.1 pimeloyl-ACP methyl ester carboxylesterase [Cryobacterium sp. CG_9.6]